MNANPILKKCFFKKSFCFFLCASISLLFFASFILESLDAQKEYNRKMTYGFHNGVAMDITEHTENVLKTHLSISDYGEMIVYGQVLSNEQEVYGYIGSVDSHFKEMENLSFLEGTYPTKENEIAIEYALLDLLHLPYTLGETITLTIQYNEETIETKEYVLCGIINTFTTNWLSNDHPLCGAITLQTHTVPIERNLFFIGNYKNSTDMKELDPIIHEKRTSELIYNDYSYPEIVYTLDDLFENGGMLFGIFAMCLLLLICIEVANFPSQLYRNKVLLSLGLSKRKLKHFIYSFSFKQWFFTWCGTVIVCTMISLFFICANFMNFKFHISYAPYLISFVSSSIILFFSDCIQILILKNQPIVPNGKDLTKYVYKNQTRKPLKQFNKKSFIKLEKQRMQKHVILTRSLCIITGIVLFICTYTISDTWNYYKWRQSNLGYDYKWSTDIPSHGLSETQLSKIKNTSGISDIQYFNVASYYLSLDQRIYISDKNGINAKYVKLFNQMSGCTEDATNNLPIKIISLPENTSIWKSISNYKPSRSFYNGNTMLCYFSNIVETEDGTIQNMDETNTQSISPNIHEKDPMQLIIGNTTYDVQCEKVISKLNANNVDTDITNGTIFISQKLYNEIFDNMNSLYNNVFAYGNNASYESTDKILSMITTDQRITFTNRRIERQQEKNTTITNITYVGIFLVLFCTVTLWIYFRWNEKERIMLLNTLGADQNMRNAIYPKRNILFMIGTLVFTNCILLCVVWFTSYYRMTNFTDSGIQWNILFDYGIRNTDMYLLFIPQIIYVFLFAYVERKCNAINL